MSLKEEESLQAVSFFNVSNILTSIFLTTIKFYAFRAKINGCEYFGKG